MIYREEGKKKLIYFINPKNTYKTLSEALSSLVTYTFTFDYQHAFTPFFHDPKPLR